jgi:hypothetical protein
LRVQSLTLGSEVVPVTRDKIGQLQSAISAVTLLASAAAFLWVCFFTSPGITRNFVTDDGYYYIKTAHNFASSLLFSFDGVDTTNGFHVLYMLSLVALDSIVPLEGLAGVRAVILLHAVFSLAAFGVAALFLGRLMGADWRPAALAALVGAHGLYSIGTEAALLLLVAWGFLLALFAQQKNLLNDEGNRRDQILVAALSIAVCLTRSDAALLVFACGGVCAVRHLASRSARDAVLTAAVTIVPALAILGGQALVNLVLTGHAATISAYLKSDFPDVLNNDWLSYKDARDTARLLLPPLLALAVSVVVLVQLRRSPGHESAAAWLSWLGFNVYTIVYSASVYLFATGEGTLRTGGVQEWYFVLTVSGAAINALLLVRKAVSLLQRWRPLRPVLVWAPLLVALLVLAVGGTRLYRFYSSYPTPDILDAATADWMRESLPEDARIYVIDHAGIIGYSSERSVVNGDGLINGWAYWQALRDGRLEQWLSEHEVEYIGVGTSVGDAVGVEEIRDGRSVVVARLALRGTKAYELIAPKGTELYESAQRWVFPMSAVTVRVY